MLQCKVIPSNQVKGWGSHDVVHIPKEHHYHQVQRKISDHLLFQLNLETPENQNPYTALNRHDLFYENWSLIHSEPWICREK
ncbi:hypothetical protein GALL_81030 [mine drainage metagenome]|uniref:Uncharacterized protein n=1 Tax=mine drainage metagenome TaxID=410659 RepID=A0A1J5SMH9_9ZZZZ